MTATRKLTLAGILIAVGVICSAFYIPIGVAKCFPIQHLINVLAGVFLGPLYAVVMAFITSFIRVMTGTGSFLAFPGSMCGAFVCGILYKYSGKMFMAFLGEVFGTGIIGSLLAYPVSLLIMSKPAAIFGFIIPFGLSSLGGSIFSMVILLLMKKMNILNNLSSGGMGNGL